MHVIKADDARIAMKDAVVLDLGDISRQAAKIRMAAEAKAAQIISEAEKKAARLAEGAETRGYEKGQTEGFDQGLAEGRQQGHEEAMSQTTEQIRKLYYAWMDVAGQWDEQRRDMLRDATGATIEFALKLAEKLVHRSIRVDPSIVIDQVANALAHVLRPLDVTVRIHPGDHPILEQAMPQLLAEFQHLEHVHLIDDENISSGGCVVSFGQGLIDATIEKQMERIVDMILPEDMQLQAGREIAEGEDDESGNELKE